MLAVQANLAITYQNLGRNEEALQMRRDVYSGYLKLHGEEHEMTLSAANNYAGPSRHARRCPRGRDDARGHGKDRAARDGWRAS